MLRRYLYHTDTPDQHERKYYYFQELSSRQKFLLRYNINRFTSNLSN